MGVGLLLAFIIIGVTIYAVEWQRLSSHENGHSVLAEQHGCINGTITYIDNPNKFIIDAGLEKASFMCNEYASWVTNDVKIQERHLQGLHEIEHYNQMGAYALAYIAYAFIVLFLIFYRK